MKQKTGADTIIFKHNILKSKATLGHNEEWKVKGSSPVQHKTSFNNSDKIFDDKLIPKHDWISYFGMEVSVMNIRPKTQAMNRKQEPSKFIGEHWKRIEPQHNKLPSNFGCRNQRQVIYQSNNERSNKSKFEIKTYMFNSIVNPDLVIKPTRAYVWKILNNKYRGLKEYLKINRSLHPKHSY